PGTVIYANWENPSCHTCLSGLTIEIAHGNGLLSYYGHLSRMDVVRGQRVQRGQVIGISGMTGSATGPHLHFGIYYLNGAGPVDPYGWSGPGADPYAKDVGDLWLTGSPRFPDIPLPKVNVTATQDENDPSAVDVGWSSPGSRSVFTVAVVRQDGEMTAWIEGAGPGSAIFRGSPNQAYWFWVTVRTDLGWSDAGGSAVVKLPPTDHGQRA
ncbi:MAG TPA: M23 family metallopeptidase, partial [Patescibacteria group bacterium]|nr:M23 family metallopeptidase [Patescibacteria group bacterium]